MSYILPFYIGFRYIRTKRKDSFLSFISLVSILGIALSVMILITVLSVMNGFNYEIKNHIVDTANHITVTNFSTDRNDWHTIQEVVAEDNKIIASAPFIYEQGLLTKDGIGRGVIVTGIVPKQEIQLSKKISKETIRGSVLALKPGKFGVVIGQTIASALGVSVNDSVIIVTPNTATGPIGISTDFKKLTVVGILHDKESFSGNATKVFVNLYDAQKLFKLNDNITGLHFKIKNIYNAPLISKQLRTKLNSDHVIFNWLDEYGPFFKILRMQKTTMFIIVLFIMVVAIFNLFSNLTMTVFDKRSDIAILRTLGANPQIIKGVFIVQGGIIGMLGTLFGMIGGILLSLKAPLLVRLLEQAFHIHFIDANVYLINYLPSRLLWSDVMLVCSIALTMSLIASIYPAWRATKTLPANALRYQ